jgi:hypothetical protein
MATNGGEQKSGREFRLLVLVIAVAVTVLVVLSRFRYPSTDLPSVSPVLESLQRLTARATYEDLASTISDLAPRLSAYVTVLQIQHEPQKNERRSSKQPPAPVERRSIPALHVRPDLALAYVPAGMRVEVPSGDLAPVQVVATDVRRDLVLVRVPTTTDIPDLAASGPDFSGLTYVAAVEAALAGPALRPIFISRADATTDDRWQSVMMQIGGDAPIPAGTFLFTLQGRLIGLTVPFDGGLAIVPGIVLDHVVVDLTAGIGGQ